MTDHEMWTMGLKEQKDTWWGKKIIENEKDIENGLYGEVIKRWKESDGWGGGLKVSMYIVMSSRYEPILVKANESGVMVKLKMGWGSANKI